MLETLLADYLRAAGARSYPETRLLLAHTMKSAMLPVVAWLAPALINIVTGSFVVEQMFGIPGMGRYFVQGALNRDYTLVPSVVLVIGPLIVAIITLVDALRGCRDPRLERSRLHHSETMKWAHQDSNLEPRDYESRALTIEL